MSVKKLTIPIPFLLILFSSGCGRDVEVHRYTEIVQMPTPTPVMPEPPRLSGVPDGLRARPLTVDPVPENLPSDHPTLSGPMPGSPPGSPSVPPMGSQAPGGAMLGREGEVPPPSEASDLSWDLPDGWVERAGSGMRAAEFAPAEPVDAIATLISLPGMAGALEANVARWRGQVGLPATGGAAPRVIRGELPFAFVNLVPESEEAGQPQSTMAAVYELPQRTLFLKFTGDTDVLIRHKLDFLELAGSLAVDAETTP